MEINPNHFHPRQNPNQSPSVELPSKKNFMELTWRLKCPFLQKTSILAENQNLIQLTLPSWTTSSSLFFAGDLKPIDQAKVRGNGQDRVQTQPSQRVVAQMLIAYQVLCNWAAKLYITFFDVPCVWKTQRILFLEEWELSNTSTSEDGIHKFQNEPLSFHTFSSIHASSFWRTYGKNSRLLHEN